MSAKLINLIWEGPTKLKELNTLMDEQTDYGVYQVYGAHPVYGDSVLLYIGKADEQTLGKRISQEGWGDNRDCDRVEIYVGRLAGDHTPSDKQWSDQIAIAEQLLIWAHTPAHNSKGLNDVPYCLNEYHVLNWGAYRSLMDEVSGVAYTEHLQKIDRENIYRMKKVG